eukprot:gene25718-biopygen19514
MQSSKTPPLERIPGAPLWTSPWQPGTRSLGAGAAPLPRCCPMATPGAVLTARIHSPGTPPGVGSSRHLTGSWQQNKHTLGPPPRPWPAVVTSVTPNPVPEDGPREKRPRPRPVRVRSASVSSKSIVRPASGPRPVRVRCRSSQPRPRRGPQVRRWELVAPASIASLRARTVNHAAPRPSAPRCGRLCFIAQATGGDRRSQRYVAPPVDGVYRTSGVLCVAHCVPQAPVGPAAAGRLGAVSG